MKSRIEKILENMLGEHNVLLEPVSRNEELLIQILEQGGVCMEAITSQEITSIINSLS